jgi:hypothetical protein
LIRAKLSELLLGFRNEMSEGIERALVRGHALQTPIVGDPFAHLA